jgi:hypothetical protein
MRRTLITILVALAALAGVGGLATASSGGSDASRARLERALPVAFENQYVQLAHLVGHDEVTAASLHATAMCDRGGPDHPDVGPGSDWTCLMGWTDPNVPMPTEGYGKFEVTVHSNDCFTAGAPSKLIGYATVTDKHGHQVTNPAFEFDGCFNPRGDNSPTGVFYPSVLNVSSTVLQVAADGSTSVQMTCGTGAEGCAGTVTAMAGKTTLGTVPFKVREEGTVTVPLPRAVPPGAQQVSISTKTTKGVPAKDTDLPVQR